MAREPASKDATPEPTPEDLTYEQAIDALEAIVERIESGEVGLADSIEAYERGVELIARCRSVLDQAEQRIEELDLKRADGSSGAGDRAD